MNKTEFCGVSINRRFLHHSRSHPEVLDPFLDDDRHHNEGGKGIGPPPANERIQQ